MTRTALRSASVLLAIATILLHVQAAMARGLAFSQSRSLALHGSRMSNTLQQRKLKLMTRERSSRPSAAGPAMIAESIVGMAVTAQENQAVFNAIFETVGVAAWLSAHVYYTKLENRLFAAHLDIKWIQEGKMGQQKALTAVRHWQSILQGYQSTGDRIRTFAFFWASLSGLYLMLLIFPTTL